MIKEADMKKSCDDGFQKFMDLPATRLMLSAIPASEVPETLQTLLRTAYEAGHGMGMCAILLPMLEETMRRKL